MHLAKLCWPILTDAAAQTKSLTYGEINFVPQGADASQTASRARAAGNEVVL